MEEYDGADCSMHHRGVWMALPGRLARISCCVQCTLYNSVLMIGHTVNGHGESQNVFMAGHIVNEHMHAWRHGALYLMLLWCTVSQSRGVVHCASCCCGVALYLIHVVWCTVLHTVMMHCI